LTSSIPPANDSTAAAPSDRLWLRSELMGTQVITRDTGRRLGVVGEVVVDIDRREVVALGLRDNPLTRFLPGLPRWMPLDRIRQVGDVILVDSADSLNESFDSDRYSKVINCQVITESGAVLGRVLGFSFDIETGELTTLVLGALGVPLLGEGVLSTWELAVEEVVSSGTDRIIVYEGAEDKLKQLGTGLLEKLGIGGSGWEQEERERFGGAAVPAENQLAPGQATAVEQRRIQPARSRAFEPEGEMEYVELEERREREPLRQRRYLDEDNGPRQQRYRDSESNYRDLEPEPEPAPRYRERDRDRELDLELERERDRGLDRGLDRGMDRGLDRYQERERSGDRQPPSRYRDPEPEPWRGRDRDQDPLVYETERSAGPRPLEAGPLEAKSLEAEPLEAEPLERASNRPLSYGPPSSRPRDEGPVDVEAEPLDDPW
jgi:sporulation protein YlmC with PRC-barrel domain